MEIQFGQNLSVKWVEGLCTQILHQHNFISFSQVQKLSFGWTAQSCEISFVDLISGEIRMELGGGAGGDKEGSGVCRNMQGEGDWQACPAQGGRGADLLILKFHTRCKNHLVNYYQVCRLILVQMNKE